MTKLLQRLSKRNVPRVGIAYLAVAWVALQVVDVLTSMLNLPVWLGPASIITLLVGFPIVLVLSWSYRLTPEGKLDRENDDLDLPVAAFGGRRIDFVIIGALSIVVIGLVVSRIIDPGSAINHISDQPVVSKYTKLTASRIVLPPVSSPLPIVADESRIYFTNFENGLYEIAQISLMGGRHSQFEIPFSANRYMPTVAANVPNKSSVYLEVFDPESDSREITGWELPVVGGSPKRHGLSRSASFSLDGKQKVFMRRNSDVYMSNADGTVDRKIATMPHRSYWPRISPDGNRIRVTDFLDVFAGTLWEIDIASGESARIFADTEVQSMCCGSWTNDGQYYVFQARNDEGTQLWAAKDSNDGEYGEPFQITSGVIEFLRPTMEVNGDRIFAIGWQLRGEIMQFDKETGSIEGVKGMRSLSAEQLRVSADGSTAVYVSYPGGTLWIRDMATGESTQISFKPMRVARPSWSPDGKTIAFEGWVPGSEHGIYVTSVLTGEVSRISTEEIYSWSPSWSPDGNLLTFSQADRDSPVFWDLVAGREANMHLASPFYWLKWSPDARFAAGRVGGTIALLDMETMEVTELTDASEFYSEFYWSADGQSLFLVDSLIKLTKQAVHRLDIKTREIVQIVGIGQELKSWGTVGPWVGVDPDGTVRILREQSIHNIYALEWNWR
jgi:Tol biopolymer transport system component